MLAKIHTDMVKAALAFLLGCLLTVQLPQLPEPAWYWGFVCLLAVSLFFRQFTFSIFIFALLWSGYEANHRLNNSLAENLNGASVFVKGQIVSLPEQQTDRIRFIFQPESKQTPHRIQLSWYYPDKQPKAGERWQFLIKLKTPHSLSNPGGFDYERWLFQHDIGATAYIKESQQNTKLSAASMFNYQHWRQILYDRLNTVLADYPFKAFILGLTIGNRDELSTENWLVLQQTGTSHLMAISGLHIGLAALFMFFIGRFLWSRSAKLLLLLPAQQAGAITALIAAIIYALLAGLSLPTQRALIMTLTVLSGLILNRRFFSQDVLALSLLFILLHDPFAVLSAGFWLSFFAVALIFFLSQNRFPPPRLQWLSIHIWLAVGLAPLTLLFFQQVSLISPFANFIAVPLVSFIIVPLSLLATALLFISSTASEGLFFIADYCLNYLWQFLSFLSELPVSHWQSAALPEWTIVLSVIMLAFLLLPRAFPARWLGLVFLLPTLLFQPARPEQNHFDLDVLDVGQGLASVVFTANHVLVFDTGRYYSKRFDMGRAVLIPFLKQNSVLQIDTLIVSHNDIDHRGGTKSVLNTIPTSQLLTSDLKQYYPQASQCLQGQHWQWDGVEFEILNPQIGQQGSDNNRSCVLKVSSPTMSALLTGDIEHETEIQLVQTQAEKLRADILVIPHHGSRSSSSEAFIQTVSPMVASVSVGYRNAYDFPAKEVLERFHQFGSQIVRTDHSGAQIYHYDASQGLAVTQWRDINHRLWSPTPTE